MILAFFSRLRRARAIAEWEEEPLWRQRRDAAYGERPRWTFANMPWQTKIVLVLLLFSLMFILCAFIGLAIIADLTKP
jgi:hypothetical protein